MDIKIPFIVAFVFLALLLLRLVRSYSTSSPTKQPSSALRLPPGPWQLPLIGSLHHLLLSRFRDLPHRALREMSGTYGPLMLLRFGSEPMLVVSSAEAAREVMKTHDLAFCNRYVGVTLGIITCGGNDIFGSPYNAQWRELRKLCMLEIFSQRRVLSFRPVREDEVANLLRSISGECGDGQPVNLGEGICRLINDVAARTVVGNWCGYRDEYLHELDEVVRLVGGFNLVDLYPSSRLVRRFSATERDARRCQRNMYRIVQSIIQEREAIPTPEGDEDLLAVLVRLQKEGGLKFALTNEIVSTVIYVRYAPRHSIKSTIEFANKMKRVSARLMLTLIRHANIVDSIRISNIRDVISTSYYYQCRLASTKLMDIFSAGSETSSTVLVWAMSELVKNPQLMHKAQSEVRETFKGHDKITEGDLVKLRYLQLVIKETLRMHPPVPLLPRECRESCQVMGYDVPKGTKVFVNVWATARDMKLWHDAEEFRPERFESTSIEFRGNDFEFTPFGAGRRICPGIPLGLAILELALASLLYHFDWELPDGVKLEQLDMAEAFGITLRKKCMLWLKAKPYNNFIPH